MSKPSIPQGTRDFGPVEVRKRQYILNILRGLFELYGFQPLETPAMENLETLTGKYGEEGDRLIFKILNNGLNNQTPEKKLQMQEAFGKMLDRPFTTPQVTERALRYDLTIPFARFVAMNQNDIAFPFRRYQMQPVWRADRPQKGRYREFWQCDADVVGTTSLLCEAELLCIYSEAFGKLGIPVKIKLNSRKILTGLAEICGVPEKITDLTIALDKLDKIGRDGVFKELAERGIPTEKLNDVMNIVENLEVASLQETLSVLKEYFKVSVAGSEGVNELAKTLDFFSGLSDANAVDHVSIDITLARGLNYYTGVIMEVVCTDERIKMGSIGGGGRYDDLTGLFGLKGVSGVGVSFGIDRIYDILQELDKFPASVAQCGSTFLVNFGGADEAYALHLLKLLRQAGIKAELYPEASKFDKQLKYANRRGFPYVLIAGEKERIKRTVVVKDFSTGKQEEMGIEAAITVLLNKNG